VHLLEGEKVTINFGGLTAVNNVDFYVDQREILGLIGPNGAGKTTLFNLISASLKPKSGVITFKGQDITGMKPHQICRLGISRTFQTVKTFGNMSVLDNVRIAALFGSQERLSGAQATKEAMELLEFVGLKAINSPAKDLTLGNQKRLEMARALATKPELLLLDELMAGLNQTEVGDAMDDIRQIRQEKGITIIMIEHVMKAIMNVCDRIIVLNYGKKIAEGTPQEIVNSPMVIEVYLGEQSNAGSK
jgi:branched-chain amino acid transport system ATP-binding protein